MRFIYPRRNEVVVGTTRIDVGLRVPRGGAVERVELRADGRLVATLTEPPWSAAWDAGETPVGHELEARLVLADGREGRAALSTPALHVHEVEKVHLVDLYLTVYDRAGSYVTDLRPEDFAVFENGVRQRIERFSTTHEPLRLAVVLDSSHSMAKANKLERAKSAAVDFLDVLQPEDEALVVAFSDEVRVLHEISADQRVLSEAIRTVEPRGGTALYDAIWRTAERLRGFRGRRVLVLLSDGRDEAANGLEPGSLHTLEEAIEQALRSEVIVFSIGIGENLDREYAIRWGRLQGGSNVDTSRSLEGILRQLAEATGGRAITTSSAGRIERAFARFADDLRHQYSIAYVPSDERRDGKWRKLRVETPGRELTVITRKGYYAPQDEGG